MEVFFHGGTTSVGAMMQRQAGCKNARLIEGSGAIARYRLGKMIIYKTEGTDHE
jgi:hypothetical protein